MQRFSASFRNNQKYVEALTVLKEQGEIELKHANLEKFKTK